MNIIITGATKGIGLAIATAFAKAGNQLFICSRNETELQQTAVNLEALHEETKVHYQKLDVSEKSACIDFGKWCVQKAGKIDILVNNAGYFIPGAIHNEPDNQLEEMLNANLMSAYHITRAVVPSMIDNKSGHIFNITSIAGVQAYANGGSYSISKFAMQGFNKNLREELKPLGIKVTAVIPGAVYTNSWSGSGVDPNRIMEVDDIAKMVLAAAQLSPQAVVEEITLRPQLGDL